jgi:hypothetical protein
MRRSQNLSYGMMGVLEVRSALDVGTATGRALNYVRTGGKGYMITEGDGPGVFLQRVRFAQIDRAVGRRCHSYSQRNGNEETKLAASLLTSGGVIVCAIKEKQ